MNKDYEIEWSNQAISNFDDIVQTLSYCWGEKVMQEFVRCIKRGLGVVLYHQLIQYIIRKYDKWVRIVVL